MKVHTIHGLVDREDLQIKDIITEEENCRIIATEWFRGEELVRRDVNVNIFSGLSLNNEQANM